jgi:predicted transcriptional regulator of viral defense system
MDVMSPYKTGLARIPQIEQAMAWLVEAGPLVENPLIPPNLMARLVAQGRILRLRRSLYLAPRGDGRLPSMAAAITLALPMGYITGLAALAEAGFTDQDPAVWHVVNPSQAPSLRYGALTVEVHSSPRRARAAQVRSRRDEGVSVRWATPLQAILDSCAISSTAPDPVYLVAALRVALESGRLLPKTLQEAILVEGSEAAARRLGYLLTLLGNTVSPEVLSLARRTHDWALLTPKRPTATRNSQWRLLLTEPGDQLLRRSL